MAAGQGQYLVSWHEPSTVSGSELFAAAVPAGRHPSRLSHHALRRPGEGVLPGSAWNGSRWLVVWTDGRSGSQDVYGTVVSADGSVDPSGVRWNPRPKQEHSADRR